MSDSGANTLKVSSGTADADYNKLQELSGVIADGAGTATPNKTGVGKLKLSGNNTFGPSSGSIGVNINEPSLKDVNLCLCVLT